MAGLGKYKKGAKFTLRSGNTPMFKHVGSSPITSPANMNSFGVGKGTSPYKQEVEPKMGPHPITDTDKDGDGVIDVKTEPKQYKIQRGDSLSKIAKANNTTVEALMAANPNIKNKNTIIAGQSLNLSSSTTEDSKQSSLLPDPKGFKIQPGTSDKEVAAETAKTAKAARKAKLGAAGRNLAEIFMGGIHNVYGNPNKTTKTTGFDEEKAYKRWAKEKSDEETLNTAQKILADNKKKSQIEIDK